MSDSMNSGSFPHRSCDEWADLLALTPEDLLSPADYTAFTEHVQSCDTCAALRDDYRLITAFARSVLSVTLVPTFALGEEIKAPPPSTGREQWKAPTSFFRSHRADAQSGVKHISRLQSLRWLVAACLIIGALVSLVWQLAFPTPIPQVQASSLSLQHSLTSPNLKLPLGVTFVHVVSWSPNGKYIAVLWDNSTIQVIDVQHNYTVIFSQKAGLGYGLAWSPDSQRLASIGRKDNTIQIWNISTHQCEVNTLHQCMTYTGHTALIEAIAWSPNGNYIASASDDQTVQVWDAHTTKQLYRYQDPGSKVNAIAWSPDGKRLVSGDDNNHVQAWDALTGTHLVSYSGHTGAITFVSWSPDGNSILSSSYDGMVWGWNVRTGDPTLKLSLPRSRPSNIFAADCQWETADSAYLALVVENSIQIWYLSDQQGKIEPHLVTTSSIANQQGQFDNIISISWSPLGDHDHIKSLIAGGSGDILNFRLE